jgi:uncharacterized membrane protein YidH (DUF202 family)
MGFWTSVGVLIFVLGLALIGCATCEIVWVNSAERFERHVRKKFVLAVAGLFSIAIVLAVLWVVPLFRVLANR